MALQKFQTISMALKIQAAMEKSSVRQFDSHSLAEVFVFESVFGSFVKSSSRRCADWWERMDSLVFGSAACLRRLLFQPLVVSCYGDRYFYGYASYLTSCKRVYRYYKQALSLDAYGHFECGVWGVWGMIDFCCTDRSGSLRSGRWALHFHRKLQEIVDVIKGLLMKMEGAIVK